MTQIGPPLEIAAGIHCIEARTGDKYLFLFVVELDHGLALIDTGEATHPETAILPFLETRGWSAGDIRWIFNSHADADHFGGNHALRQAAPQAVIACHNLDRRWVASVENTMREHYDAFGASHGVSYDSATQNWLRQALGQDTAVDLGLSGGERVRLGAGRSLLILHTPGHTPGHLTFWDESTATAIVCDAILGDGVRDADGALQSPPPYYTPQSYLSAIQTISSLAPERLLTCHYPLMEGAAVTEFVEQSRAWVEACDEVVRQALRRAGEPLTLAQLIDDADERLGPFPFKLAFKYTIAGHAEQLVEMRQAQRVRQAGLVAWQWLDQ